MPVTRCKIDETARVWHSDLVNLWGCKIGARTRVAAFVEIGHGVTIGEDCLIQGFTYIPPGVTIGARVFVGPRVTFTNDKYPPQRDAFVPLTTVVHDDVSIGAGAVILPGVTLFSGCRIGAGAVVTHDVLPGVTVVGNPAREMWRRSGHACESEEVCQ